MSLLNVLGLPDGQELERSKLPDLILESHLWRSAWINITNFLVTTVALLSLRNLKSKI